MAALPSRRRSSVTDINDPGRSYEIDQQRIGLLDPMILAPRLVTHAAELANRVFEVLDPDADPRIPHATATPTPPEYFFGGYAANSAILSSPLAGLTDWQMPIEMSRLPSP
jgi:hypothetical protein